jgi:ABC-type phosphate/phosphonate transport system substrate-binding protein
VVTPLNVFLLTSVFLFQSLTLQARTLTIGVMHDSGDATRKYQLLANYISSNGIDSTVEIFHRYHNAVVSFNNKKLDALIAGSGVGAILLLKKMAYPLVRPVSIEGWSTYEAVILSHRGGKRFNGDPVFFDSKQVACTELASSGEFFIKSMGNKTVSIVRAGSHLLAIRALNRGIVDIAVVKNRVWNSYKAMFPDLEQMGEALGSNPNMTLMISKNTNRKSVAKLKEILLGLGNDNGTAATKLKKMMKIEKFIPTEIDDFHYTLKLLNKSGITSDFSFKKN